MNKTLLIKRLSQSFVDLSEAQLHHMTETTISLLADALLQKERIEIRGFGRFAVKTYQPRKVHNPRSGRYSSVGARVRPSFKASKLLLEKLNDKPLS